MNVEELLPRIQAASPAVIIGAAGIAIRQALQDSFVNCADTS